MTRATLILAAICATMFGFVWWLTNDEPSEPIVLPHERLFGLPAEYLNR